MPNADKNNEAQRAKADIEVSVEFTLASGSDVDRFDHLLDTFIEDEDMDSEELVELTSMVVSARRVGAE